MLKLLLNIKKTLKRLKNLVYKKKTVSEKYKEVTKDIYPLF